MSEEEIQVKPQPGSFTDLIKPGKRENETVPIDNSDITQDSIRNTQDKLLKGLGDQVADITLENIKKLAPQDKFEIPENSGIFYDRQKITPKQLRKLKKAEADYARDIKQIEDSDLRLDREFQLTQLKADIYLGMTKEQFEDTDIEYLNQILQATELRTQGFRKR